MIQFELGLEAARQRQRRMYILSFSAFIVAVGLVAGVLLSASGTSIEISPEDARAAGIVSVEDGYAIAFDHVVYGFTETSVIFVRAPGFQEERRQIEASERGGTVTVTLREIPGRLVAKTAPAQANTQWALNGAAVDIAETLVRELASGEYVIGIENPYFEPAVQKVVIERARNHEITVTLKPIDGQLKLASEPDGAAITIDGKVAGKTPAVIAVQGGRHAVSVEKEDFIPVQEDIEITHEQAIVERDYRLKPVASTLTVSVSPSGGQLLLDGRKIDPNVPQDVSANVEHSVSYLKGGYHSRSLSVTLAAREDKNLDIRLKPDIGDVEVSSNPSAEIYVNGLKVGKTPAKIRLKAVSHVVELRRPGYRTVKQTIKPSSKRKTIVHKTLVSELAARRAESPRVYRNSAGIEMILFEPGNFVMGAPRHQKGQRANEFVKEVTLRKSFYAGKHEVTNAQFKLFEQRRSGSAQLPVTSVTWLEAALFCNWLSEREGLSPVYGVVNGRLSFANEQADGYRLLTEAEWEWLARKAGKKEQSVFPWGDESVIPKMAGNIADESANGLTAFYIPNYNDGYAKLAPVGSFGAEASGLHDLTGNVSEWVHDLYSLTPPDGGKMHEDPMGPETGEIHVVKGASWRSGTRTLLRAAYREGLIDRREDVGFRVARYLYGAETKKAN